MSKLTRVLVRVRAPAVGGLAILLTLGVIGGAALAEFHKGTPERIAALVGAVLASPQGPAVATVGGLQITRQRIELEVAVRSAQGVSATRARILDALIDEFVVLSEAQRRGIRASDADVAAFVAEQKAIADADPERGAYRYAAALGVAGSAVWSHPQFVTTWREMLTYGALKRSVLGPVTFEILRAKEAQWAGFVAELRAKTEIRRFE